MTAIESQKEKLMRILNISEAEAEAVMADDKAIDKGEKLFELTDEQKKVAKKMSNFDSKNRKKPMILDLKQPKNRKGNATKGGIISELHKFLVEMSEFATESVEITNKERQISFSIGSEKYELTLVQKRKPKA